MNDWKWPGLYRRVGRRLSWECGRSRSASGTLAALLSMSFFACPAGAVARAAGVHRRSVMTKPLSLYLLPAFFAFRGLGVRRECGRLATATIRAARGPRRSPTRRSPDLRVADGRAIALIRCGADRSRARRDRPEAFAPGTAADARVGATSGDRMTWYTPLLALAVSARSRLRAGPTAAEVRGCAVDRIRNPFQEEIRLVF